VGLLFLPFFTRGETLSALPAAWARAAAVLALGAGIGAALAAGRPLVAELLAEDVSVGW
jgi:hypothetical protein